MLTPTVADVNKGLGSIFKPTQKKKILPNGLQVFIKYPRAWNQYLWKIIDEILKYTEQ